MNDLFVTIVAAWIGVMMSALMLLGIKLESQNHRIMEVLGVCDCEKCGRPANVATQTPTRRGIPHGLWRRHDGVVDGVPEQGDPGDSVQTRGV